MPPHELARDLAEVIGALADDLGRARDLIDEMAARLDGVSGELSGLSATLRPVPRARPLWGYSCPQAELDANIRALGVPQYIRDFDTAASTGVRAARVASMGIVHYSDKGDTAEARRAWASRQTRAFLYTYHHEPHGDVPPTGYRDAAQTALSSIWSGLRDRSLLLGHGPILTRFWMARNDPGQYFYSGATHFYVDAYIGDYRPTVSAPYPDPEWMFGRAAEFARQHEVPWGVPELGGERNPELDPDGSRRAEWMLRMSTWLADAGARYVGWWQRGGTAVLPGSPEALVLRTLVAG